MRRARKNAIECTDRALPNTPPHEQQSGSLSREPFSGNVRHPVIGNLLTGPAVIFIQGCICEQKTAVLVFQQEKNTRDQEEERNPDMRIDARTCAIIKKTITDELGSATRIRLFGSRADDRKRGGDIDLHLEPEQAVRDRIRTECRLAARLFVRLGGRKVDLLIHNPHTSVRPVDEEARRHGVIL